MMLMPVSHFPFFPHHFSFYAFSLELKMSSEDGDEHNEVSPIGLLAVKVEIFEDDEMEDSSETTESIPQKSPVLQESSDGSGPSPGPSKNPPKKVL
jgi:hypothetical protein